MQYVLHLLIVAGVYAVLAMSLSLLASRAGFLSVAHAAMFGLGAYVYALLGVKTGAPFLVAVAAAGLTAALAGLLFAVPSLRIRDDYFVIASLGFQVVVHDILNNWVDVTGGPLGLGGIPQPRLAGMVIESRWAMLAAVALLVAASVALLTAITSGAFGRGLAAIREDEVLAQAFGIDTLRAKLWIFAVSTSIAAVAGAVFASYMTFIDPSSFSVSDSILILAMVILGGRSGFLGPALWAVVLVFLPEALRFLGLPSEVAANLRQMLFGALMVALLVVRGSLGPEQVERG